MASRAELDSIAGPLIKWRARQDSIQLLLRGAYFKLRLKTAPLRIRL
jgi:hypothetical protein